jgi:PIN domain nuclease of toxin-antitoxin system
MEVWRLMVYLDTHLVVWLYAGFLHLLPPGVIHLLEENELYISPIVLLELQYLKETNKITKTASHIVNALQKEINLKVCEKDFHAIIRQSLSMHWTRDPFDRLTVAHASLNDNILLTKDDAIRSHYRHARWAA